MSAVVTILDGAMTYRAVLDETGLRTALVIGTVRDEVTGVGLDAATLRVDRSGPLAKVVAGGYFAVSGVVDTLFPDLATTPYALTLTFSADRHHDLVLPVPIPAGTAFPLDQGVQFLRPFPVRLEGRVTRESNRAPIGGAKIEIHAPAKVLMLRTPAHVAHAGASLTPKVMANAPGATLLTAPAPAGDPVLHLNAIGPIALGTILRFGVAPATEYAVVAGVDGAAKTATLHYPLWRSYPFNGNVQPVTAAGAGAVATVHDIDRGDGLVQLAAAIGSNAVEITDAPALLEYHETNVLTDGSGFYGVDGLVGVPSLTLRTSAGGFITLDRDWTIDYAQPVAELGFRLKT